MTDVEATVQRYYGDWPVMQRVDDALRAAGVDPEKPSHRDLWPFDQLHSQGIGGDARACGTRTIVGWHIRT
jgi:hypothetical protein